MINEKLITLMSKGHKMKIIRKKHDIRASTGPMKNIGRLVKNFVNNFIIERK